jgi:hypothetical protein
VSAAASPVSITAGKGQRSHALSFENLGHVFGGPDHVLGVGHASLLAGRRLQSRESRGHPEGGLDPFLDGEAADASDLRLPGCRVADAGPR